MIQEVDAVIKYSDLKFYFSPDKPYIVKLKTKTGYLPPKYIQRLVKGEIIESLSFETDSELTKAIKKETITINESQAKREDLGLSESKT